MSQGKILLTYKTNFNKNFKKLPKHTLSICRHGEGTVTALAYMAANGNESLIFTDNGTTDSSNRMTKKNHTKEVVKTIKTEWS